MRQHQAGLIVDRFPSRGISTAQRNNPPEALNSRVDYFFRDMETVKAINDTISVEKLIITTSASYIVTNNTPSHHIKWIET